jgi:Ser-tRNA(Ala) deacylase AlaX
MTTERLYYADSYLTEFEATVLGHGDGGRVYLDRSAFYPTSGGQQHDVGSLQVAGAEPRLAVVDVVDEGDRVAHVLGAEDVRHLAEGRRVRGQLDWARRFDHMQQHSGQHLLSAVFQELLELGTVSVHFGLDASTLDLDAASIDPEQVLAVERRANAAVFENRSVSASVEETAEGLRKQSARAGPLRIVTIDALDRSACGGTHVAKTERASSSCAGAGQPGGLAPTTTRYRASVVSCRPPSTRCLTSSPSASPSSSATRRRCVRRGRRSTAIAAASSTRGLVQRREMPSRCISNNAPRAAYKICAGWRWASRRIPGASSSPRSSSPPRSCSPRPKTPASMLGHC